MEIGLPQARHRLSTCHPPTPPPPNHTHTSCRADKWLDVQTHESAEKCLTQARAAGYRIVAAHLSADAVPISDIDWTQPTAFVLGNEMQGVPLGPVAAGRLLSL